MSFLQTLILGIPLWAWLLGVALGFLLEWLIELVWWRGRGKAAESNRIAYLETELLAAKKEVNIVRNGGEFQGLRADFDLASKAKLDVEGKFAKLTADFNKLSGDHKLKLGEIATLTAGAAVASVALKAKDVELGKVKAAMPDLSAINADWDVKLKARDAELSTLRLNLDKLEGDGKLKLGEIATLTAGAAAAAAAVKAKDAELSTLRLNLGKLEGDGKLKLGEIATLTAGAAAASAALKAKDAEIGKLKLAMPDLGKINADWEAKLKAKDTEFASLKLDIDKHKGDSSRSIAELATLTAGAAAAALAIKGKDDEIAKLKAAMPDVGKINADWQLKLGNIEAMLKTREKELADANAKFAGLQAEFNASNTAKLKLDHTIVDLQKEIADLRAQLKACADERMKLQEALHKHDGDTKLKLAEVATLTAGAATAAALVKGKDDEIGKLKLRLGELEGSTADWTAKFKAKEAEVAKLNLDWDAKLKGLNAELGTLKASFAKLEGDNKLKVGEIATLTAGTVAASASIKAKDADLGKLRLDWEAKLKAKEDELAKVKLDWEGKLKAKDTEFASLKLDADKHKGDNTRSVAELATLTAGAAAAALAIKGKDDEIAKLKAAMPDVGKMNADWQLKLKAAQTDADDAKSRYSLLENEMSKLRNRIGELEGSLKAKDTDLSGWNTRFLSLQGDFDKFKVTAKGNDDEVTKLRARIAALETDLSKSGYTLNIANTTLKSRDQHVADLQAEIAALRKADGDKASQLLTFTAGAASAAALIKTRESDLGEANARYGALDKSYNDAKWRVGELEAEIAKLRGGYGDYEARIAGLEKSMNDAKGRTGELESAVGGKDKDINDLRWRIGELEAELASLRGAKGEVENNLSLRENDLSAYRLQIGELEGQIASLKATPAPAAAPSVSVTAPAARTVNTFNKGYAEEAAAKAGVEVTRTECPQHLSEIDGIGTVFEQRLYEFGIGTYWEVANMSNADLSTALRLDDIAKASKTGKGLGKNIDLEGIRADAMRLANETGTAGRTWLGGNPDDFEPIDGIGHVFELRLYNAGICTYEALIKAGVARLAAVCRPPSLTKGKKSILKEPDYEGWIEQAIRLMNDKNKGA